MPKLEDVEKLKEIVDSLGGEKELRGERGEELEEVSAPQQDLSNDLQDLLGIIETTAEEALAEKEQADVKQPADFSGLQEFPESEPSFEHKAEVPSESAFLGEGETESFSLSDLTDFTLPEENIKEKEISGLPETDLASEAEGQKDQALSDFPDLSKELNLDSEQTTPPVEESAFELKDFNLASLGAEFEAETTAGEKQPEAEVSEKESGLETPAFESEDLAQTDFSLGDFELPDFGETGKEESKLGVGSEIEEGVFNIEQPEAESSEIKEPSLEEKPFSEEMPDLSSLDLGEGQPASQEEITGPEAGDFKLDEFSADQFSLPDLDKTFEVEEQTLRPISPTAKIAQQEGIEIGELKEVEETLEYSASQFENIKATLNSLPLNLKLIVEELIGEKGLSGNRLKLLLDALASGESPKGIANLVTSITGEKIQLPKSFEKKTGLAFEKEKDTFAYYLRTKGKKVLIGIILGSISLIFLAGILVFYILPQIQAKSIYDEGYAALLKDRYEEANKKFNNAAKHWRAKDQYYRYAEGFIDRGAYFYAHKKYAELLKYFPNDKKGLLDYSRLQTKRGEYSHAEKMLVDNLLMQDSHHYEGIQAAGENYLNWAKEDFTKLKDAEYYYNYLIEIYPERMQAHLQKILYLIRAEQLAQEAGSFEIDHEKIIQSYVKFIKKNEYKEADPVIYTELASYLIDKKNLADVKDILLVALEKDASQAEAWYEYARFARLNEDSKGELKALQNALQFFEKSPTTENRSFLLPAENILLLQKNSKYILTLNRLGEYYYKQYLEKTGEIEKAEASLEKAQRLFEQNSTQLLKTRFAQNGEFGKIYYNLANISFLVANWYKALEYFKKAESLGFKSPDQTFKKGFVYYRQGDYNQALDEFFTANTELPDNENVLYALATTQYMRRQYGIAEGYYLYLLKLLGEKKDQLPEINYNKNPEQRNLIINLYTTYNNLGCTYFKQASLRNDKNITEALLYFQKATELYDVISRDPDTMVRLEEMATITVKAGKKQKIDKSGILKAPTPLFNLDVVMHNKAGTTYLGEYIDVAFYNVLPADLGLNLILPIIN